jgi:hypothetical protein
MLDMKARIENRFPQYKVELDGRDQMIVRQDGKTVAVPQMGNLRDVCSNNPADCERHKEIRLQLLADMGKAQTQGPGLDAIRQVVRPAGYKATVERQFAALKQGKTGLDATKVEESMPLMLPLGPHFVRLWVADMPTGMQPLSQADLLKMAPTQALWNEAGSRNLRQENVPVLVASKQSAALFIASGNDYVSSVLLDEPLWARVAQGMARHDAQVCVPERVSLIAYFPHLDSQGKIDFAALCAAMARDAAPTFSGRVIRRSRDNWQLD